VPFGVNLRPPDPSQQHKSLKAGAVTELQGIARFKFHEGKLEELKRLSAQCIEIVRTKDTGTLQYDIYFNEDQSECIVHERYRDSDALIEHAANIGDLMEAILATGSVSGELLGEPSAELRAKMAGSEVRASSRLFRQCRTSAAARAHGADRWPLDNAPLPAAGDTHWFRPLVCLTRV
jgi:quinol monooxygenase YgiN